MPTSFCNPPGSVTAGDTLKFSREFPDYPASAGWKLSYALVGATSVYAFNGVADGARFDVTVPATGTGSTSTWTPGNYSLQEIITSSDDSQRFTIGKTPFAVGQNLAAATGGVDTRTHARKVLDAIEAYLEARPPTTYLIMIDGKRLEHYPLPDILAMRDKYRVEVQREYQSASGQPAPKLLVRL